MSVTGRLDDKLRPQRRSLYIRRASIWPATMYRSLTTILSAGARRGLTALMVVLLSACASETSTPIDGAESGGSGALSFPKISLPSLPAGNQSVVGSSTEVYTRIAHGAVTCWFGAEGPLKGDYVYHANAAPPSKGGQARIVVHARDPERRDRRGKRAFVIDIVPEGQTANVTAYNATMSEALALRMRGDVGRWAADDRGCIAQSSVADWAPDAQGDRTSASKEKKSGKKPDP